MIRMLFYHVQNTPTEFTKFRCCEAACK